jgi:RimJ/RimL family protein N-acetyltransferase
MPIDAVIFNTIRFNVPSSMLEISRWIELITRSTSDADTVDDGDDGDDDDGGVAGRSALGRVDNSSDFCMIGWWLHNNCQRWLAWMQENTINYKNDTNKL